jgi:putative flippase GtrA
MSSTRIRSLLVSLASTALDVGLFALCTFLLAGFTALAAARWITGALGALCNFALNRAWAFRSTKTQVFSQAWRYALAAAGAVSIATALWIGIRSLTGCSCTAGSSPRATPPREAAACHSQPIRSVLTTTSSNHTRLENPWASSVSM